MVVEIIPLVEVLLLDKEILVVLVLDHPLIEVAEAVVQEHQELVKVAHQLQLLVEMVFHYLSVE